MDFTKSGAYIMVKNLKYFSLAFLLFFSLSVQADFLIGVSTNSWQEKIPVVVANVEDQAMTTFAGYGPNLGFDFLLTNRIRYAMLISYLVGRADLHKMENAVTPRRNFYSSWFSNKIHWRVTKTFSFGGNFILNYRQIDELDAAISTGGFLDFDFDLFNEVRLTQSLGTMSDSRQLAYSLSLIRKF